jgi:hypothetical protein
MDQKIAMRKFLMAIFFNVIPAIPPTSDTRRLV